MNKTVSNTRLESEVKHCQAYGKFAVDLLEFVANSQNLNFDNLWSACFPNLEKNKAIKNATRFIKHSDPRSRVASAKSDYQFYLAEQSSKIQKKNETFDVSKHGKAIGQQWKKLSDAEKKPYRDLANTDKERRNKELQDVEEQIRNGTLPESPFRRATRKRSGNVSGLNMYVKMMTQELKQKEPQLENKDRMKRIHSMWKKLNDKDKQKYEVIAQEYNKANADANASSTTPATSATSATPATTTTPAETKPNKSGKKNKSNGKKEGKNKKK